MSRREDLERLIRESYGIIRVHKETIQTSDRPEEKLRSQRAVDAQWVLIEGYRIFLLCLGNDHGPPLHLWRTSRGARQACSRRHASGSAPRKPRPPGTC
jgi:hypothetical protein